MTAPFVRKALCVFGSIALGTLAIQQGSAQAPTASSAPAQKQKAPTPVTMTECEGVNNCATWTFLGSQGTGQWPTGELGNLTVEHYDDSSVEIHRADSTGSSAGLTATYKGTRKGDRVGGEFVSSWPGHWEDKAGNWYATVEQAKQGPPGSLRVCPLPITVCSTWTLSGGHYDFLGDNGVTGTITIVSFDPEGVVLNRADNGRTAGYSAVYSGKMTAQGNRILQGDWSDSNGGHGHFSAAWGTAIRDLPTPSGYVQSVPARPALAAPVVCVPWFFGMVCG